MRKDKSKRPKNVVLVLIEGESEKYAFEGPLSELFDAANPGYRVIFAQQRKRINQLGVEQEDGIEEGNDNISENQFDEYDEDEGEYAWGGDITSSSFVTPTNIETKITNRFFKPLIDKEKIYPKMLLQVIQIIDMDGAYIANENIVPHKRGTALTQRPYYDCQQGVISCSSVESIIDRNARKKANIDYLRSLSTIKIGTKSIPYSAYFFSANLDHFLHNDPNLSSGKISLARTFSSGFLFNPKGFVDFFMVDSDKAGKLSYEESWNRVTEGSNSLHRATNFDILIKRILDCDLPQP